MQSIECLFAMQAMLLESAEGFRFDRRSQQKDPYAEHLLGPQ